MKIYKYFLMIMLLSFTVTNKSLNAQKNNIYGTLGLYSSLNYERLILTNDEQTSKLLGGVNAGKIFQLLYASDDIYEYRHAGVALNWLTGGQSSFFESKLGFGNLWNYLNSELEEQKIILNLNVGYRYASDDFLFRIGAGFPELLYLSAGIRI